MKLYNQLKKRLNNLNTWKKELLILFLLIFVSLPLIESLITTCNFIPVFEDFGQVNCNTMPLIIFSILSIIFGFSISLLFPSSNFDLFLIPLMILIINLVVYGLLFKKIFFENKK